MIYTDREYLSILTMKENRDYATYDELIHVLSERPSDAVYVEKDGVLCGLITYGDVMKNHDEKTRRVQFNQKFTSVHPGESWHVRQIFNDNTNINALPVISEDGHLLGDYTRWNDFIGIDYAELLWNDPCLLQGLKANIPNTVFIQLTVLGRANRHKIFSWWKQKCESEGIRLQVIQHWELKDYIDGTKYILYADEDERRGITVLYQYLYHQKLPYGYILSDYLYRMSQLADISFLKELQNQGVFVLAFDFMEHINPFYLVLDRSIRKRNEEYGVNSGRGFEAIKEFFGAELYCEAYKTHIPCQIPSHAYAGIPYLCDVETEFCHVQNGERLTSNQPKKYDRCIYMYGPCVVIGLYVPDQYTIASLLQSEINRAGFSCKVVNRGFHGSANEAADRQRTAIRLQSSSFMRGDIIVVDQRVLPMEICPIVDLTDALEKYDAPPDWFHNCVRHCNHRANQVFAHAIYKELIPILQKPPRKRDIIEENYDYIDRVYLRHYFSNFDHTSFGAIGSIVMNCNPFTLGHRFLIEEALKAVDFLIVFVVEEDESLFSFQERFAMVCHGTSDLKNIMMVPSGPYILSKNTFPEYFEKINDEDLKKNTEDDVTLFAEKIAPKLGITYRFVGEEQEDKVTKEYNEAMKRILPRYGIHVVEIPRKVNGWSAISASRVRQCLSMNHMDELDELIPVSTKRILFF